MCSITGRNGTRSLLGTWSQPASDDDWAQRGRGGGGDGDGGDGGKGDVEGFDKSTCLGIHERDRLYEQRLSEKCGPTGTVKPDRREESASPKKALRTVAVGPCPSRPSFHPSALPPRANHPSVNPHLARSMKLCRIISLAISSQCTDRFVIERRSASADAAPNRVLKFIKYPIYLLLR
jgi:hypothetical protein